MQESKDTVELSKFSDNEKLFELDEEFAQFFIENLPGELDKLKQVCKQHDISAIKFQAHKMAPTLRMMKSEKAAGLLKSLSKIENDNADIQQIAENAIFEVESAISDLKGL